MCAINGIGLWLLLGFSAFFYSVTLLYREMRYLRRNFSATYGSLAVFHDLYLAANSWKLDPKICKYVQKEDRSLVLASGRRYKMGIFVGFFFAVPLLVVALALFEHNCPGFFNV